MAATKQKINYPARERQRVKSFYMRCAASKINNLLKGVTVSHNLKWVQDVEEYERLMATLPAWAADWPIRAAGGYISNRYRKD